MEEVQAAGDVGIREPTQSTQEIPGALPEVTTDDGRLNSADSSSMFGDRVDDVPAPPRRSSRSTAGVTSSFEGFTRSTYTGMVNALLWIGTSFVLSQPSPNMTRLMTNVSVPTDDYLRENPSWEKAREPIVNTG